MFPQTMQYLGILISLAVQQPALPEILLGREAVLPPDVYLVKAHAQANSATIRMRGGEFTTISFKIEHVYVGPADLKDQTFSFEQSVFFMTNLPQKIPIPVAKGEMGIWWIEKEKGKLVPAYTEWRVWDTMVFAPALKDGSKDGDIRYEMAVAKAEVFEKIYHADDKNRLKVIDDYVRTHDSIRGAAALMLLLRGNNPKRVPLPKDVPLSEDNWRLEWRVDKNPKIAAYVLPLSKDESLSPRVQWEVQSLLGINKEGWKGSLDEWKMIERWFTGSWKEKDNVPWEASEEIVLLKFLYTRPLSIARQLELAVGGLSNASRSDRFKAELLRVLKATERVPRRLYLTQAEEGLAYLVRVIRKDAAPSKRVAAAKLLCVFAPLSAEHRAVLDRLRRENPDDDVRKEVTTVLMEK